jgi:hypothetical protein
MFKTIIEKMKWVFENREAETLEAYIVAGDPQSTYDVERLHYQYQQQRAKSLYPY